MLVQVLINSYRRLVMEAEELVCSGDGGNGKAEIVLEFKDTGNMRRRRRNSR